MNLEDSRTYDVVVNLEGQYSIWNTGRELPSGWTAVGKSGSKTDCLSYIRGLWTDMRPSSLRAAMEADRNGFANNLVDESENTGQTARAKETLVDRLRDVDHPLRIESRGVTALNTFKDGVRRGYVYLLFTDTVGGTELGMKVNREGSNFANADLDEGTGSVHLVGELNLDGVDLQCTADINLATLEGSGRLHLQA